MTEMMKLDSGGPRAPWVCRPAAAVMLCALIACSAQAADQADDPYEKYVQTSKDFKRVKQDKEWALKAWPSWVYMPWYAQWTIGFDDAAAEF